ncbi:MAG: cytochrome c [Bdellovibrionales bacterium]|nr:cytochrome c [Bdellovibrionales bacterium]
MGQDRSGRTDRLNRIKKTSIALIVAGLVTIGLFQNCDGGFHYDPNSGELSSLGAAGAGVGSADFKLTTFSSSGLVVSEGQSFQGGVEYKVVASGTRIADSVLSWSLSDNSGNCVLKSGTGPETRFVTCDKSGRVSVQVTAIWPDGSTSVLASARTTSELIRDLCGTSDGNRIVFRIPAGTGTMAWNSSSSPVLLFVGQTLRICNDDSANHQLHTDGQPCANQSAAMSKGQFYDCSIANTTVSGLYDHIAGTNAAFYLRTLDGAALYADTSKTSSSQSCASCHNAFANSSKLGSSFTSIKNAITSNRGGMGVYSGLITDDEIRAIAYALNR